MATTVFSVQDRTGTVAQLSLDVAPGTAVAINDTGTYTGTEPWNDQAVAYPFTVGAVLDPLNFSITTALPNGIGGGNILQSAWPPNGTIDWLTGANAPSASNVLSMNPANAYTTTDYFKLYHKSRGNDYGTPTTAAIQQAIVVASEYIDIRYRFRGVKLLQFMTNPVTDALIANIDPWLSPFGFTETAFYTPSATQQATEWPRQGAVDYNGDSVYGVPRRVQDVCALLAIKVLNGTVLLPDYDGNVVSNGAVISSHSVEIGPIKETTAYDTKFGLGFFADFPQATRMLRSAGLLVGGGGRTLIR